MSFLQQTPFFRLLLPVIAGILIHEYCKLPTWLLFLLAAFSLALFLISYVIKSASFQHKFRWVFGCGVFLFFTVLAYSLSAWNEKKNEFSRLGQEGVYLVEITDNPIEKARSYRCKVRVIERADSPATPAHGNAYIYLPKDSLVPTLLYGDRLWILTTFQAPEAFRNPDGFDYPAYLKRQGIGATAYVSSDDWEYAGKNENFSLRYTAGKCRNYLLGIYRKFNITGDEFAVLAALTLGYTDELHPDLRDAYSNSGAAHVLAVSGLHVGIIYVVLAFLLGFLNKSQRKRILKSCFILLFLWAYAFITGLSPSVVRASCMFSFVAVGGMLRRTPYIYNTICMSAFFMLLVQPFFLFHVGFRLSYAAVVSIIYFQPKISGLITVRNKLLKWIWDLLSVSVAAQIGVFPFLLYYFQTFPNYFLLTNMIAIPAVTLILYSAIALFVFSGVPFLSTAIAFLLNGTLRILNISVDAIQHLPYSVSTIPFNAWQVCLVVLGIISLCYFIHSRKYYPLVTAACCLLLIISISTFTKYQTLTSKKMIVYASNRNTHINFLNGSKNYAYTTDAGDLARIASTFWNNHYIKPPCLINEDTDRSHGMVRFDGKSILILSEILNTSYYDGVKVDYLIIGNGLKPQTERLFGQIKAETIIVDETIGQWYRTQIEQKCREYGVHYHSIGEKGAFIINM